LRFSNWLGNGQGSADTENGAYTITALGITNNSIIRNAGANIFLTSEDEWYKAAYYDVGATGYFDYPAGSDVQTTCAGAGAAANTANCGVVSGITDVGSYTGSASPNGTFDQGGNVWEWHESILGGSGTVRGFRGGSFIHVAGQLAATAPLGNLPSHQDASVGFRVASVIPEPGTGLLLLTGLVCLTSFHRRCALG
jgi:formylglycine-generating enzyme required for sulfatase activity